MAKVMRVLASYNPTIGTTATVFTLPAPKTDLANPASPPVETPANAFVLTTAAATPTWFVAFDRVATSSDFDIAVMGIGQHRYAIPRTARTMSVCVSSSTAGCGLNIGTV